MKFARLLLVGLAFALVGVQMDRQTEARTSPTASSAACECNRNAPENVHSRWQPNSTLRIMVTRGEFKAADINAFQDAIRLWKAVLPNSGTGIDLQYGGEISGDECASCIVVRRKEDLGGTFASLSMRSASGGFYSKAVINIKADVRKPLLLRMLLTHELGHAFGLDDCVECDRNTTVMNSVNRYAFGAFSFLAPKNMMAAAPTPCDVARIQAGYAGANVPATYAAAGRVETIRPQVAAQSNPRNYTQAGSRGNSGLAQTIAAVRNHASRTTTASAPAPKTIPTRQIALFDSLSRR